MTTRNPPTTLRVLVASAALLFALPAHAGDAASADALFREGRDAMKRGDYATACTKLAASQRLDPAPGTALNLGDCLARQGKIASAAEQYRAAMDGFAPGDDRLPIAKREWAALDRRVPRLTIHFARTPADGTTLARDGMVLDVGTAGSALPVDPGRHEVVVSAPGHKDARYAFTFREGEGKELTVDVGDAVATPARRPEAHDDAPDPAPFASRPERAAEADTTRTVGWILGGTGLAGVAFGTFAISTAHSHKSDSDRELRASDPAGDADYDAAKNWQTASIASFAVGGVALATGAYLLLTPRPSSTTPATGLRLVPTAGNGAGGASLFGRW